MMLIGMAVAKYFGLWCDRRAWDLAGKTSKM
jgi:hypothetical protein